MLNGARCGVRLLGTTFSRRGVNIIISGRQFQEEWSKSTTQSTARFRSTTSTTNNSFGEVVMVGRPSSGLMSCNNNNNSNSSSSTSIMAQQQPKQQQPKQQWRHFHWTRPIQNSSSSSSIVPFKLADIGEGIMEVEILRWYVEPGQSIKRFQKVCEVQSDKATVEITSRYDGVIRKVHYNQGQMAKVGFPLIDIEVADSTTSTTSSGSGGGGGGGSTPQQAQTTLTKTQAPFATTPAKQPGSFNVEESIGKVLTTPAVRRIARENNIDLTSIRGTGKDGRVMKEDVLDHLNPASQAADISVPVSPPPTAPSAPSAPSPAASPAISALAEDRIEPVRGIRRTMIKTMSAAAAVPHLGYCDEIQMDSLMQLRASLKEMGEKRGISISYMPFFIKSASLALKQYPLLNSSLTPDLQNIIFKASHNIGIAMDTAQGLLVPNIKNVQSLSIFEIAAELNRLQKLGKEGKLGPADLSGGTFTLSNIGTIGGTYASPVLMLPEVCIGALGKIQKVPRFTKDNQVVPMNILYISWSADHRIVDGATVANFSNAWKNYLEHPQKMIMDLR